MNPLFTLYEADDKHLAIGWGPMTFDKVLTQAFELILEGDTHLSENQLHVEWALYYEREKPTSLAPISVECATTAMMLLCEWLNEQRGGYRHYFTEEEEGVE